MSLWHLLLLVAVAVAGVAAVFDWRTGEIPNWLTFGAIVSGLLGNGILGFRNGGLPGAVYGPDGSLLGSVLGMLVCGATPILLYRVGGIGGGDVKLLIAIGALLRTFLGLEAELYAFVATTLYAPARLVYEGKLLRSLGNSLSILANNFRPEEKRKTVDPELLSTVRFGPGIFLGTVIAAVVNMRLL